MAIGVNQALIYREAIIFNVIGKLSLAIKRHRSILKFSGSIEWADQAYVHRMSCCVCSKESGAWIFTTNSVITENDTPSVFLHILNANNAKKSHQEMTDTDVCLQRKKENSCLVGKNPSSIFRSLGKEQRTKKKETYDERSAAANCSFCANLTCGWLFSYWNWLCVAHLAAMYQFVCTLGCHKS